MNILFRARRLLTNSESSSEGAGILVRDGLVAAVARSPQECTRLLGESGATDVDLGDVVLMPGLVNAHAHLDLGTLHEKVPARDGFVPWIGALLRERAACSREDFEAGVRTGAARLLETGTTTVGEVDSTGAGAAVLGATPLRARVYREVLDAGDGARRAACEELLSTPMRPAKRLDEGVSPHAPHTVSAELLERAVDEARRRRLALSMHWAETAEETRWLLEGEGPFRDILGASSGIAGLERIRQAGAFDVPLSLVHANCAEPAELERVAQAGIPLVHCPGTQRFFEREPAPLLRWAQLGIHIALGTDSLASNDDLDMRREMALVCAREPGIPAATVLGWATLGGARALGLEGRVGELRPGAHADFVTIDLPRVSSHEEAVAAITSGLPGLDGVWIAGEPCRTA